MSRPGGAGVVVVVGGGPRATYLLQGLARLLDDGRSAWFEEVVVLNAVGEFGSGWVHDPGLPGYALLNRSAEGLAVGDCTTTLRDVLVARGEDAGSAAWVSRADHGAALADAFRRARLDIERHGIAVTCLRRLVTDVEVTTTSSYVVVTGDGVRLPAAAVVLLVGHETGHAGLVPRSGSEEPATSAPYPWPGALPGREVCVTGSGLSAIELALHLTQGQGGRFEPGEGSRLVYRRGGREPAAVTMVSPSGLLPLPRPWDADRPLPEHRPVFLRPDRLPSPLSARALEDAIRCELAVTYAAWTVADGVEDVPERLEELRVLEDIGSWPEMLAELAPAGRAGSWPSVVREPLFRSHVLREQPPESTVDLLRRGLRTAQRGVAGDPVCAAFETVLRRLRPVVQALCDRRRLPPVEDRLVRRRVFAPVHKCVNGASIESMRRLAALVDAGLLAVTREQDHVARAGQVWLGGHVPSAGEAPPSTLTRRLAASGLVSVGPVAGYDGLLVDERFQAVSGRGVARPGLFVLGAPLEGFRSFQFSAARPDPEHEVIADVRVLGRALMDLRPLPRVPSVPSRRPAPIPLEESHV